MGIASYFSPYQALARALIPVGCAEAGDGAHDQSHILRVWKNIRSIAEHEGGDLRVLCAAAILHDCVAVAKDSALRAQASRMAAERASEVLRDLEWSDRDIEAVAHAIEAHSFSANVVPITLEAKILQDADRLDAIGLIGVARCFYVSGALGRSLYDPMEPWAVQRTLDDARFGLDHFQSKLLTLSGRFETASGARLAQARHRAMEHFVSGFLDEVGGKPDL